MLRFNLTTFQGAATSCTKGCRVEDHMPVIEGENKNVEDVL